MNSDIFRAGFHPLLFDMCFHYIYDIFKLFAIVKDMYM